MNRTHGTVAELDADLDLVLERVIDVPVEDVWQAWTDPERLKVWFTPRPYSTSACDIDLRPGGTFRTVIRSPEGDETENAGCFLEIVPNERLVWTTLMRTGFRPHVSATSFEFTAVITFEPVGEGTRYTARVMHRDADQARRHDELGFTLTSPRGDNRGGSVVFDFTGSADVCRELNRRKFFCDHRPGVGIRIAPHFYTKPEEIELFFTEVKKIRGGAGAR